MLLMTYQFCFVIAVFRASLCLQLRVSVVPMFISADIFITLVAIASQMGSNEHMGKSLIQWHKDFYVEALNSFLNTEVDFLNFLHYSH